MSVFTTSFNAELAAIKKALQYTYPFDWPDITILTDSKSAIQAISSFKWESSSLITEILNIITNLKSPSYGFLVILAYMEMRSQTNLPTKLEQILMDWC